MVSFGYPDPASSTQALFGPVDSAKPSVMLPDRLAQGVLRAARNVHTMQMFQEDRDDPEYAGQSKSSHMALPPPFSFPSHRLHQHQRQRQHRLRHLLYQSLGHQSSRLPQRPVDMSA